jgi:hypothetical protein
VQTALLINEISPHLPVYTWGPAVGRVLDAARRGFTLLATAHADSVHEFVGALTGSPLRIPLEQVAAFEFIVVMERDGASMSGRRVRGVWRLTPTQTGAEVAEMATPSFSASDISSEINHTNITTQTWFPLQELANRQRILDELRERHGAPLPFASLFPDSSSGDLGA